MSAVHTQGFGRTAPALSHERLGLWQDHGLEAGLDIQLIPRCAPALPFGNTKPVPVYIEAEALNTQRAIGTTLSHEVMRQLPCFYTIKPAPDPCDCCAAGCLLRRGQIILLWPVVCADASLRIVHMIRGLIMCA
jgi:hypothetical protein